MLHTISYQLTAISDLCYTDHNRLIFNLSLMPIDEQTLKRQLKAKDKEIAELKELLAAAEGEVKELNDFGGFEKPKKSILESRGLNTGIKVILFLALCALIIGIGVYPWLNQERFLGSNDAEEASQEENIIDESAPVEPVTETGIEPALPETTADPAPAAVTEEPAAAAPKPEKMVEVVSDVGWLNVRNQPTVTESEIVKKINSGEQYEWMEKTDSNWYKIVLDEKGTTGYVSGEYVKEVK